MFTFRLSSYHLIQYLLICFVSSGVIANHSPLKCADVGQYCLNHWDCCSNSCLSYMYRCTRSHGNYPYPFLGVSYKPTVTLEQIFDQNFGSSNAIPDNKYQTEIKIFTSVLPNPKITVHVKDSSSMEENYLDTTTLKHAPTLENHLDTTTLKHAPTLENHLDTTTLKHSPTTLKTSDFISPVTNYFDSTTLKTSKDNHFDLTTLKASMDKHFDATTLNTPQAVEDTSTIREQYLGEEKTEAQTDGESETTQEPVKRSSERPRCAQIGEKCYRHEDCCDKLCHGYLHQCVT